MEPYLEAQDKEGAEELQQNATLKGNIKKDNEVGGITSPGNRLSEGMCGGGVKRVGQNVGQTRAACGDVTSHLPQNLNDNVFLNDSLTRREGIKVQRIL
ncbi:hypothetical protein J6590_087707 [Homalodisca vitripennis]|nr:hypothetical protein J6590_091892 [Homalodisca vitripennis]KAG8275357.1 hypothetical protein J6590_087707 [Homalodisca vitripennis]